MADSKITALTALTAADPVNDMFPVVDVSDTTMAASGTTKKISVNNILGASGTATLASATITGDLTVDTSTLKVNSTTDRVGIGTATPGVRVDILSDSNTSLAAVLRVNSNNAAVSTSIAYDGVVASNGLTLQAGTSSSVIFNTNGANEAGRINTTGVYVLKGGTTTANGVGVAFPATQSASSDANTLDDYEEGTWTGTLKGAVDPTIAVTATGRYTKVGRVVTVQIAFEIVTTTGASGAITISGLPFTNNASLRAIGTGGAYLGASFTGTLITEVSSSASSIAYYGINSNAVWSSADHTAGVGRYFWANVTYTV